MKKIYLILCLFFTFSGYLYAEDGSRLWLRYEKTAEKARVTYAGNPSPIISNAVEELENYWTGLPVQLVTDGRSGLKEGGYHITGNQDIITIASASDAGLLYGAFHLLRLQYTGTPTAGLDITEEPSYAIRILNHWDNLDGTIERGYAGYSIWRWDELPSDISPRYRDYARANASIGINAAVLNNVNANPKILSAEYLEKVSVIADVLRPYGMKVYLSVNFASPKVFGGLPSSDPLDKNVQQWWKEKAGEIYTLIPDFGGFLVKANSEGEPGPQDYGRTHADGANMLASALEPHGGIVMWRAFVYDPDSDDRAKQAYNEFIGLDGQFADNVIVQVKNGPIDFQPREPFNPLFGAMKKTPLMIEFQITQEYLGHSTQLAYLSPMYKECLDADTYAEGPGTTVARATDGTIFGHGLSAIAGVANIGLDINWTGHHFAQANWYCFGRLAWDHGLTSEQIAEEWLRMTFTQDLNFIGPVKRIMLSSHEAVVDYMMPLGLHHLFAGTHHYGPEPWYDEPSRPDWRSTYYHRATENGIGFDRTASGTNAVGQYSSPLREIYNDPALCPDNLLLWFHHLPWDFRMKNGRTLWDNLCYRYTAGVGSAREFQRSWDMIEGMIDDERFVHVQNRLRKQTTDAVWWRDACLLYFQGFSKLPIPYELERPVHDLEDLMKIKLDMKHHN